LCWILGYISEDIDHSILGQHHFSVSKDLWELRFWNLMMTSQKRNLVWWEKVYRKQLKTLPEKERNARRISFCNLCSLLLKFCLKLKRKTIVTMRNLRSELCSFA
jgi:hypothetical protein